MIALENLKKLSKETLPAVTVLTGEDLGQYQEMREALLSQIAFDPADLSYSYFDLSQDDYDSIQMDLESLPFFSDYKIVLLDNLLDLTTDKKAFLDDQSLKHLEAYLEHPVETTRLILLIPGKLDGKRRLVKLLKRDAQVFEAAPLKEADLRTYFQKQAHQDGMSFESGVFETLLRKSNFEFSATQKNLAFLKAYKSEGAISQEDIDEAVPKSLQDNIFDLSQLLLKGQIDQARSLVMDLRLQGEDEIKLIAVLLGQFRILTQVRILWQQGKSESQIVSDLSDYLGRRVNPYQIKYAMKDSRHLSLPLLYEFVTVLIETDYQIKSGLYDKAYLFDVALLKLVRAVA
ncbi:DNA polymerase III subunit delta [Streptococcus saliviloxodontae]|uniref:DNA polymerase III subunit delta n=1 Tax=Streptococcus saliviloxodontae TaxID=1349416 RepID=A0ABS2PMA7_9STRE|nr:DNA polymerase III subunit delta [Streptococcus saliviloxodontae]MBM7636570.1 DNA polymerase-3 subunit delta [Streptococcus saliviloxodontae]